MSSEMAPTGDLFDRLTEGQAPRTVRARSWVEGRSRSPSPPRRCHAPGWSPRRQSAMLPPGTRRCAEAVEVSPLRSDAYLGLLYRAVSALEFRPLGEVMAICSDLDLTLHARRDSNPQPSVRRGWPASRQEKLAKCTCRH